MAFWSNYGSHYSYLLKLGIPLVIGQLGVVAMIFADTLMIGWYGTDDLAAASFVNGVFMLATIFLVGFSFGLTPVIGSLFGRGDERSIGVWLKNGLVANAAVGLLVILLLFLLYLFLHKLGQPSHLLPLMRPYFLILLSSLLFVVPFNVFKQFADGITDTSVGMWIMLIGNLLNIVLNYFLIFGVWGFPEWGLMGAGIATLVARVFMLLAYLCIFFFTRRYAAYRKSFSGGRLNKASLTRLNTISWPIAVQMGLETSSFTIAALMMGWVGAAALAAHQILCSVGTFCYLVYCGIGAAISIRVSNFMGQDNRLEARRAAYSGFHLILVYMVFILLLLFCMRHDIGGWFTDDTAVQALVLTMFPVFMLYQFGDALQITFANALRGTAVVKYLMPIAVVAYILISLPAGYLFGFVLGWGATGVWMAFPFGLTTAGILFYWQFNKAAR